MKTIENTKEATDFNDRRMAILTLALVTLLLLGTVVVFAGWNLSEAADAEDFTVTVSSDGKTLTFGCTSTGEMPEYADWTNAQKAAIDGARSTVTTIVFPSGENKLTSIASGVFRNFTSLETFTVPLSVSTIGEYAFEGCTSLSSFAVEEGSQYFVVDSGVLYTKVGMFPGELVRYPSASNKTAYVMADGSNGIYKGAFSGASNIVSLIISPAVNSIKENTFYGCSAVETLAIPKAVTSIDTTAFTGMTGLSEISVGSGSAKYSTFQGVLFEAVGDNKVAKAIFNPIMNKGTYDAKDNVISLPFGCTQIADGTFRNSIMTQVFIPEGVTSIGAHAFDGCSLLRDVYIPKTVTSVGEYAFANCTELLTVYGPLINYTAGHEFEGCTKMVLFYTQGTAGTASVTATTLPIKKTGSTVCKLWDSWVFQATNWTNATEASKGQPVPSIDFSTSGGTISAGTMYYRPALDTEDETYLWDDRQLYGTKYASNGGSSPTIRATYASTDVYAHRLYQKGLWLESTFVRDKEDPAFWQSIKTESGDNNEAAYIVAVLTVGTEDSSTVGQPNTSWGYTRFFFGATKGPTVLIIPEGMERVSQPWAGGGVGMAMIHIPSTIATFGDMDSVIEKGMIALSIPSNAENISIVINTLQYLDFQKDEKRWFEKGVLYTIEGEGEDSEIVASSPLIKGPYMILRGDTDTVANSVENDYYAVYPESELKGEIKNHKNISTYFHKLIDTDASFNAYFGNQQSFLELGSESVIREAYFTKWATSRIGVYSNQFKSFQFDFEIPESWHTFNRSEGTEVFALNIFGIGTFKGSDGEVSDPTRDVTITNNIKYIDMDKDPTTADYLNRMGIYKGHLYILNGTLVDYGYIPDTDLMWVLTKDGNLIIHGNGQIPQYPVGTAPWYSIISDGTVKHIHICEGVTGIGDRAFKTIDARVAVKGVMLPYGLKTIGSEAFAGLKMAGQYIPDAVETIAQDAFRGCALLEYIQMNNNQEFYTLDGAIYTKEKKLYIVPEAKASLEIDAECTEILGYAAYNGVLTDINLSKVDKIGEHAFDGTSLRSVDIDHIIHLGEYAFANTDAMESVSFDASIDFPKGVLFNSAVKVLAFGNFSFNKFGNDSMPTGIWYYQGYQPYEVNSANAGEVFEGGNTYTRNAYALSVCSTGDESLKYYINFDSEGYPTLNIVFTSGNGVMASYPEDGAPWAPILPTMKAVVLAEGMKSIGNYAFSGLNLVGTSDFVNMPTTVRTIGEGAFKNATVTSIDLSGITSLGEDAFKGCTDLKIVETSNSLRTIPAGAFSDCTSLVQLTIGENVMTVEAGALTGSTALAIMLLLGPASEKVTFEKDSVSKANATWYRNAKADDSVTIAAEDIVATGDFTKSAIYTKDYGTTTGVDISKVTGSGAVIATKVGDALLITGSNALPTENLMRDFATSDATRAEWSDVGTIMIVNVGNIGTKAFTGLTKLNSISLDGTIDIGNDAFNGCTSLMTVSLPETTTLLGAQAFSGCTSLLRLDIDNNIQAIGSNALSGTTASISYSGNNLGSMSDYTATPIVNESVLKNYLLDRSAGYAVKAQMVRSLFDVTPGMLVVDTSKQLDLNGFIIQSKGYVFDVSGSPVVTDSNQRYSTYVFDKNGSYIISDYTEYTFKFKGGAIISGTHVMGVETVDDEAVYGDKALDYYMPRADVKLADDKFSYTGSDIEPGIISVWVDGSVLRPSDYAIDYEDNLNIGTGYVILSAKNDNELTIRVPFMIVGDIPVTTITMLDGVISDISSMASYTVPSKVASDSFGYVIVSPEAGYEAKVTAVNAYIQDYDGTSYRLVPDISLNSDGSPKTITVTIDVSEIVGGVGEFRVAALTNGNAGALIVLTAGSDGGLMGGKMSFGGVYTEVMGSGSSAVRVYGAISNTLLNVDSDPVAADGISVEEGSMKCAPNVVLKTSGQEIYHIYAMYTYEWEGTNTVTCPAMYGNNVILQST